MLVRKKLTWQVLDIGLDVALVLTTFDGPGAESLGSGQKMRSATDRPIEAALPAVDISIVDTQSLGAVEVQVSTPIYVRIAAVAPNPEWICAARMRGLLVYFLCCLRLLDHLCGGNLTM